MIMIKWHESDEYQEKGLKVFLSCMNGQQSGPEIIKLFSCSALVSMKFSLPINVKMPTIVGILTFISRKNSILGLAEPEKKVAFLGIFIFMII